MCEVGYNIMDVNQMSLVGGDSSIDLGLMNMLEAVTSGFINVREAMPRGYIAKQAFAERVRAFVLDQATGDTAKYRVADWPSIHVNYRFVVCTITKFPDYVSGPKISAQTYSLEGGIDVNPSRVTSAETYCGVHIDDSCDWRSLPVVTNIVGYERVDHAVGRRP